MSQQSHILWLASWYPSLIDPLEGDFIQRHAKATATFTQIELWAFIEDQKGEVTKNWHIERKVEGNLTEVIVYYFTGNFPKGIIRRSAKIVRSTFIGFQLLNKRYCSTKPAAIHSHIILYAGLLGYFLAKRWRVPLILSEQWTAYLEEATPNFSKINFISAYLWRNIVEKATAITAVSNYLAQRLTYLSKRPVCRIPNVVDQTLFKPNEKKNNILRFITISADSYQKNLKCILQAVVQVAANNKQHHLFELLIVHHPDDAIANFIDQNDLRGWVKQLAPMPQEQLAQLMSECNALILYSRYETFGCVAIEAMATGIPVIASNIPVLAELICDGENGFLVDPNNPKALAYVLQNFSTLEKQFDHEKIHKKVLEKYNYQTVGKEFVKIYESVSPQNKPCKS